MPQTEAQRRWYERNRERILERMRVERETDPETFRARDQKNYVLYKERHRAGGKAWAAANSEKTREYSLQAARRRRAAGAPKWRDLSPENHERDLALARDRRRCPTQKRKNADRQLARVARKKSTFVEDVSRSVVFERDEGICGICGSPVDPDAFHVDHVIPLARGGEHSYKNVQLAHPLCNISKGARYHG